MTTASGRTDTFPVHTITRGLPPADRLAAAEIDAALGRLSAADALELARECLAAATGDEGDLKKEVEYARDEVLEARDEASNATRAANYLGRAADRLLKAMHRHLTDADGNYPAAFAPAMAEFDAVWDKAWKTNGSLDLEELVELDDAEVAARTKANAERMAASLAAKGAATPRKRKR